MLVFTLSANGFLWSLGSDLELKSNHLYCFQWDLKFKGFSNLKYLCRFSTVLRYHKHSASASNINPSVVMIYSDSCLLTRKVSFFLNRLWDIECGACLRILEGHEELVRYLQYFYFWMGYYFFSCLYVGIPSLYNLEPSEWSTQ